MQKIHEPLSEEEIETYKQLGMKEHVPETLHDNYNPLSATCIFTNP